MAPPGAGALVGAVMLPTGVDATAGAAMQLMAAGAMVDGVALEPDATADAEMP